MKGGLLCQDLTVPDRGAMVPAPEEGWENAKTTKSEPIPKLLMMISPAEEGSDSERDEAEAEVADWVGGVVNFPIH